MLQLTKGDVFEHDHEAYAHGVNTQGVMNAGIATEFKQRYPEMFTQYKQLCQSNNLALGDVFTYQHADGQIIFNLATQDELTHAGLGALEESIQNMYDISCRHDISDIAMPYVATGKGKLSEDMLFEALHPFARSSKRHVTLYEQLTQPSYHQQHKKQMRLMKQD